MPRLREFRYQRWAEWAHERVVADRPPLIAFDTETTGLGFYDEPFAATVTWRTPDDQLRSGYFDLESEGREARIALLRQTLLSVGSVVGWNLKFDLQKAILVGALTRDDIDGVEWHDGQTMLHLLDENRRKALKIAAVDILKHDDTIRVPYKTKGREGEYRLVPKEEHRLSQARKALGLKKEDGYHLLPRDVLVPYALRDTEFTLRLYETLAPRLEAKDEKLRALYRAEMELLVALLDMEADGFALDLDYLERTTSEYGVKVMEGWNEIVALTGRPNLNPNSPKQLLEVFEARGIALEDTQEATLRGLDDELARRLLQYRADTKLYQTYLRALLREQRDGIAHPSFNPTGARTGRMSSSTPRE